MMGDGKEELRGLYAPIEEVPLEKVVLWGLILVLLVALRPFYPLFFLTFVFGFLAHNAAEWLLPRLEHRYTRKQIIAYMFILFVLLWVAIGFLFVPRTITQAQTLLEPGKLHSIAVKLEKMTRETAVLSWVFKNYDFEATMRAFGEEMRPKVLDYGRSALGLALQFLLAILFSFLITYGYHRLATEIARARETRLHALYDEVAPEVHQFGSVMGRVFQAQTMIALANTVLTAIGMLILGIPSVIPLAIVVFLCSFIPVLGVFISSAPICLVALTVSGPGLVLGVIGMVCVVHAVEAYLLNPRIMGAHMKINPILVLGILIFSEHYFGLWGMILGVPICYYLYHYVLKEAIARRAQEPAPPPSAAPA